MNGRVGWGYVDQLRQLRQATWDGNLIGPSHVDALVKAGLAMRYNGWSIVTLEGLKVLLDLGLIVTGAKSVPEEES